jgi:invasion protein IalB
VVVLPRRWWAGVGGAPPSTGCALVSQDVSVWLVSRRRRTVENMYRWRRSVSSLLVAGLLLAGGSIALGQQPPARITRPPAHPALTQNTAPAQPAQNEPQRTSATYEDWVVQCVDRAGAPPEKICDMEQVTHVQESGAPFSRIMISRPAKGQPFKLIVQVPVNASFHTEVRISMGESDPGLVAPFARCLPSGCFADFDLKDDAVKKFGAASAAGKLLFADAGGRDVAVPLSFKGFIQAYEALLRD